MRKLAVIFLSIAVYAASISAFAANGDVAGHIYSTDIKAYINGVEVPSYNIGGKTVVIIEDVATSYEYCEPLRVLMCSGMHPDSLMEGGGLNTEMPGKIIGDIYETDIKTYVSGKEVQCFSLNEKMAVAIEEMGADGEFSDAGGAYFWNKDERTISLKTLYDNSVDLHRVLSDKHLNMAIDYNTMTVEFEPQPITWGGTHSEGVPADGVHELTCNGEKIGYSYRYETVNFSVDENGEYSLDVGMNRPFERHWDTEKIAEIIQNIEPVAPTHKDWLEHFEQNMYRIASEFETDEYHFLYMSQPSTHGSSQFLVKISKTDGNIVYYSECFESVSLYGQRYFENVRIDEENEKVYLHYDADYVIHLKTDEINPLEIRDELLLKNK